MHVRVSRYNPEMDFVTRTHEYAVKPIPGESILDLLTRIKHTQDGSLTFRGSCGYGGCGSCGVKVNGKPVLGCTTQVGDSLNEHHALRIDPLDEENVIKDLVIDEKNFFEELLKVKPWMVPRHHDWKRKHQMGINDVAKLGNAQQCIACGICNASASSSSGGECTPFAFVKGFRYASDIRDGDSKRWETLSKRLPVHYSLSKANACPRDIYPGDKIQFIQHMKKNVPVEKRIRKPKK